MKKKAFLCMLLCVAILCGCSVTSQNGGSEDNGYNKGSVTDNGEKTKSNEEKNDKKEDGKDKKASKTLGAYQKFVRIHDEGEGFISTGGIEPEKNVGKLSFSYDVDLDGKKDNISITQTASEVGISEEYEMQINDAKLKFVTSSVAKTIWGVTLDGESMYIAIMSDDCHEYCSHLFQYINGKVVEQGIFGINCLSSNYCPEYDTKYLDKTKINEDGSIVGMKRSYTIQCSNYEVLMKADNTGKIVESGESKERTYIEKNDITLKKELVVYEDVNSDKTKKIKPQKINLIKGVVVKEEDEGNSGLAWYYIKGKNGDDGWICVENHQYKGNGDGEEYDFFEGLILYD